MNDKKVSQEAVLNRLRYHLGITQEGDLAETIGLKQPDFSNRKKRGTLIYPVILWACEHGIDMNWLLRGDEPSTVEITKREPEGKMSELVRMAKYVLEADHDTITPALESNIIAFHGAVLRDRKKKDTAALDPPRRNAKGGAPV
jgi:hypothetical protein